MAPLPSISSIVISSILFLLLTFLTPFVSPSNNDSPAATSIARSSEDNSTCYDSDSAVFPYWSTCECPAMYEYLGGVYNLVLATNEVGQEMGLAPEMDTDHVRLSDAPAEYVFTHSTREYRFLVKPGQSLLVQNRATGRFLAWKNTSATSDDDDATTSISLLVEVDRDDEDEDVPSPASFTFGFPESTISIPRPCPRIADARCLSYTLLSSSTRGISSNADGNYNSTDLTLSDTAILPFLLLPTDNDTSNCTSDSSAFSLRLS